ncbi:hypothetical protein PU560_01645, partial [Georgenia sp. 10Sc9-8]|nr:hypothetical protein [Georgenia halotolerans]
MLAGTLLAPLAVTGALAETAEPPPQEPAAQAEEFSALVFSATAGFRHGSIEEGVAAIEQLGADNGFSVD